MEYLIIAILILASGLFSGLTLGLLSLSKSELEMKIKTGNKKAEKVYSVRKRGNLLLCTLLVGNVAVNSAISIILASVVSGLLAGVIATSIILIFGEIIPQATFSKYALELGSRTTWLVKIFIVIFFPICFPIAYLLDKALGREMPTIWNKKEIGEIVKIHEDSSISDIDADEERIILGALSFSDKRVKDVLTPRTEIVAFKEDSILNIKVLNKIKKSGHSRCPVYKDNINDVVGILFVRDLIALKIGKKLKDVYKKGNLINISLNTKLDVILNRFIKNRTHMAFVFDEYGELEGLVTLEDVIEEILRVEIVDETDTVVDLRKRALENAKKKLAKLNQR